MNESELLLGYKKGKYTAEDVLGYYEKIKNNNTRRELSLGQKGLWMIHKFAPHSNEYNVPICLKVRSKLDLGLLKQAFAHVVESHEQLSCFILEHEGNPYLVPQPFQSHWFTHTNSADIPEQELKSLLRIEAKQPFDLSSGPLVRMKVYRRSEDEYIILIVIHHIVFDGASTPIFLNALFSSYEKIASSDSTLEPVTYSYEQYVNWEHNYLSSEKADEDRQYWITELEGAPSSLLLDIENLASTKKGINGATQATLLNREYCKLVKDKCRQLRINPSTMFLGVFQMLLERYSGEHDLVIGVPTMGRPKLEFYDIVGYFINMMPIRQKLEKQKRLSEHLAALNHKFAESIDHSAYPFPKLVNDLHIASSTDSSPVFQVSYVFQNNTLLNSQPASEIQKHIEFIEDVSQEGEYKLVLEVFEDVDKYSLCIKYDQNKYRTSDISHMLSHYVTLLTSVLTTDDQPIGQYEYLERDEYENVVIEPNRTKIDFPAGSCIHELFEDVAGTNPKLVALNFDGKQLTYSELNKRANKLANYIVNSGIKPDAVVAICLERSFEMVETILAIVKAGGAYLPIDPSYPEDRIRYMLQDSGASLLITDSKFKDKVSIARLKTCFLDTGKDQDGNAVELDKLDGENLSSESLNLMSTNLAYIIYTSGSTGRPKAVMIEHRALMNRIDWMQRKFHLSSSDVVLQKTPFSFDVSVWEFFWPLITGASIVIAKPDGHLDPEYLTSLIQSERITTLHFVPSMFRSMLNNEKWADCASVRQVFSSGEALTQDLVKAHYAINKATLINLYGPTEATIDVSYWVCPYTTSDIDVVPIGKPIQNTALLVLNEDGKPQGVGCKGELFIGGVGLARGYLSQPQLSEEKFIVNTFSEIESEYLYRTGDFVKWASDGNLIYCGRIDDQVKIRGRRIELSEIESCLNEIEGIKTSVVAVKQNQTLVAYIVVEPSHKNKDLNDKLATMLSQKLPEHMIPISYVEINEVPVTSNGKVNRDVLPEPDINILSKENYVAPRSDSEKLLVKIWSELLGFSPDDISIKDNFFALGGHSLMVTKLMSRLYDHEIDINLRKVFDASSLEELAKSLDSAIALDRYQVPKNEISQNATALTPEMLSLVPLEQKEIDNIVKSVPGGVKNIQDIYPLAPLQEGMLFHHLMHPNNDPYVLTGVFSFDNKQNLQDFVSAMQEVVNRHDVLRTSIYYEELVQPVQVVWRRAELNFEVVEKTGDYSVEDYIRKLAHEPNYIDLARAPMIQLKAAYDASMGKWYMMFGMHHLVDDATSLKSFFAEVLTFLQGKQDRLKKPGNYRDFVGISLKQMSNSDVNTFFEKMLGDIDEPTTPFGLTNVYGDGGHIVEFRQSISAKTAQSIRAAAKTMRISPATIFHAAWAVVISRCATKEDVVFGTVLSGRVQTNTEGGVTLGNFINTLPMRVKMEQQTVSQLLKQTDKGLKDLLMYEQASLSLAQRCTKLDNDVPLFNAVMNYRHMESDTRVDENALKGFGVQSLVGVIERTNYPIIISVDDLGDEFSVELQVDDSLSPESIINYLEVTLSNIVTPILNEDREDVLVSKINILPDSEKVILTETWNNTEKNYQNDKCIHEVFTSKAIAHPDKTGVICGEQALSFKELDEKTNSLANCLLQQGVKSGSLVGVMMHRSIDVVVGLLAILKTGAAYIPLDPESPEDRVFQILQDSKAKFSLIQSQYSHIFEKINKHQSEEGGEEPTSIIRIDELDLRPSDGLSIGKKNTISNEQQAYVIYTSGTTGIPKGVSVTHKSIMNTLYFLEETYPVEPEDSYLFKTNYTFDVSLSELFGWFIGEGHLVVLPPGDEKSPHEIIDHLQRYSITHINFVPSVLNVFMQTAQGSKGFLANCSLKYLMVAGEAFSKELVEEATNTFRNSKVENIYGPTETSIYATHYTCSGKRLQSNTTPIGKPVSNTRAYILDKYQNLTPLGIPGELCISGSGVAEGYLNNASLTNEKFINNPFEPGTKMYRTGDLVCWNDDGNIEYLGRLDFQVKIRGFRIELGEIEYHLSQHSAIRDAVVVKSHLVKEEDAIIGYPVVNQDLASACYNILELTNNSELNQTDLFELDNGIEICGINKDETEMQYRNILNDAISHLVLSQGDNVMDIGANIGLFGVAINSLYGDGTLKVFAYEPNSAPFDRLSINSRIFGEQNIIPQRIGISNTVESGDYHIYRNCSFVSGNIESVATLEEYLSTLGGEEGNVDIQPMSLDEAFETINVPFSTISKQIETHGLDNISLVRIAVGVNAEMVLNGISLDDWKKIDQFMIEVVPNSSNTDCLIDLLTAQGFGTRVYDSEAASGRKTGIVLFASRLEERKPIERQGLAPLNLLGPKRVCDQLFSHIRNQVPSYMVPSRLMLMERLPLNASGKVDRNRLPAPSRETQKNEPYVRPTNHVEEMLLEIWAEILEMNAANISIYDNFFNLGGHSLLATSMVNAIRIKANVELSIKVIFDNPTIVAIAEAIGQSNSDQPGALDNNVATILDHLEKIEALDEEQIESL